MAICQISDFRFQISDSDEGVTVLPSDCKMQNADRVGEHSVLARDSDRQISDFESTERGKADFLD